jgi:hypothetical protein
MRVGDGVDVAAGFVPHAQGAAARIDLRVRARVTRGQPALPGVGIGGLAARRRLGRLCV